jgi:hypothetical protein
MDPQKLDTPHNEKLFIGLVLGLILGGGCGYYAGWIIGQTQGVASATESMTAQIPTIPSTVKESAPAINPLEDAATGPLDGVKLNPFE